jgi:glucose-1-phosphate adenylyltransferase
VYPNLVILAAGISSRMKKSIASDTGLAGILKRDAQQKSKSLIGVGKNGRPFLDYLLYNAREAGYRDIMIVVGENDGDMRAYYGSAEKGNRYHGLFISYAVQKIPEGRTKPLGTADALLCALNVRKDWAGQSFIVCNSDNLYSHHALSLLLETGYSNALIDYDRSALQFEQERIAQFAVIQKDAEGFLTNIMEKPSHDRLLSVADAYGRIGVSMNIFKFSYHQVVPVLQDVPLHPVRQEKEIPQAVMMMVKADSKAMATISLSEYVPDLTSCQDIQKVQEYLDHEFGNFSW